MLDESRVMMASVAPLRTITWACCLDRHVVRQHQPNGSKTQRNYVMVRSARLR
jgi:hypothetical protein